MDSLITQLFNYIPESWRPYVAIVLLLAYFLTKWGSMKKTQELNVLKASKSLSEGRALSASLPVRSDLKSSRPMKVAKSVWGFFF